MERGSHRSMWRLVCVPGVRKAGRSGEKLELTGLMGRKNVERKTYTRCSLLARRSGRERTCDMTGENVTMDYFIY